MKEVRRLAFHFAQLKLFELSGFNHPVDTLYRERMYSLYPKLRGRLICSVELDAVACITIDHFHHETTDEVLHFLPK